MFSIPGSLANDLIERARTDAPIETCGYLGEKEGAVSGLYPLRNLDAAEDHFTLDPVEQFAAIRAMRAAGESLRAVYHSHPASPARLSEEDLKFTNDPEVSYVIISLLPPEPVIRSFRVADGQIHEEPVRIL